MAAPSFNEFLAARGFDPTDRAAFVRRMFVTAWGEPGFHRFWRLWNPLYGYGLFRLYLVVGGNRRPLLASLLVFLACGFFLHDLLVVMSTRRLSFATTLTFGIFWLLASVNRAAATRLGQERWSRGANALANGLCVLGGLAAGVAIMALLR